ncbi:SDR family NAD(P)-dependent oxidoreductase [Actinorugispora endophytica]|uniref:3-oxoacyl-[acyl-carrier protein] reductase n=1 Tax=Actinorugispora endophytica TaxID=1605990 RepID=A0A4R6UGB6_9ACTN|nr:SDR family oxidoreductase [Actinorugispora endophytica]TDQ45860.1 3-oxoacyl-[acyl-carrier protein] reductase [Actinorugispora endophytica]
MDLGLAGARVVVTGASRGIGRAIAEAFAAEGADLAVCARSPEPLREAADALRSAGAAVVEQALDVADARSLRAFVDRAAAELGGVDVLVSNVSGGSAATPDQWERGFGTDVMPFVRLAEYAEPHLAASARGGSIVLISSTSALHAAAPPSGPKAYGAVKAALNHHAAALGRTLPAKGIRVNTVSPGPIEFEGGGWARRRENDPGFYEDVRARIPYGRLGRPEEVARAVVFLASPAAAYVTGANLVVDGGFVDRV